MISDYLKARLAEEIPGILTATAHLEGGKQVIRINGASAYVSPLASDNEVEAGIRLALNIPKQSDESRERQMSVEDIKHRFATVPGIENLAMRLEGGKQVFTMGGPFISIEADATEEQIEAAIRQLSPGPSAATLPAVSPTGSAAVAKAIPAAAPTPADAHVTVKDMMASHMRTMAEIHETQIALLKVSLERQAHTVATAVGNVADRIDSQTDDFEAMMGQISNGFGL